MTDVNVIHEQAKTIAGLANDEADALLPFCKTAAAVLNERIRDGADESDIRLITAAAALALYKFYAAKYVAEGDVGSFKAGDVTVSYDGAERLRAIDELRKSAFADAHGLLTDDSFIFDCI